LSAEAHIGPLYFRSTIMKLFSAFGAADSLEKDRQTVRRVLRSVAPDGHEDGQPRWKLTTILKALDRHLGHTSAPAEAPPMHLAALYVRLDQLYDKVISSKSVAHGRRVMCCEFFPTLYECTQEMMAAYTADHSLMYTIEHERTQLAVCRKACGWHMDEMMAEYAAATQHADDDE
jgi:hypothetical protein